MLIMSGASVGVRLIVNGLTDLYGNNEKCSKIDL